jgi:hypothetical protein
VRLADGHADPHLVGDLLERLARVAGLGHRARVAQVHPPEAPGQLGDEHEQVGRDEVVDPRVVVREAGELDVHHGHHPDAAAGEPDARLLPHPALRPVTAGHPVIPGGLGLVGIHPAKLGQDLLAGLGH